MSKLICPTCDQEHEKLSKNIWISEPVCEHCVFVWYDSGITDPEIIKKHSLERQNNG